MRYPALPFLINNNKTSGRLLLQRRSKMASECEGSGKSSWPELVGTEGEAAAAIIERENPSVNAVVVLEGTPVTQEIDCTRVRVWVNDCGVVTSVPVIR